jgi:hypothetical protein
MGSGDVKGDGSGDAKGCATREPEGHGGASPLGGRFWVLAEDLSDGDDSVTVLRDQARAQRYVLDSASAEVCSFSDRFLRKERKRLMQGWAARERKRFLFLSERL